MRDTYEITTDPSRLDVERIHHWLSTDAWWAHGRSREQQDKLIAASLNFVAYEVSSLEQVGYARVITDHGTFAWLCDVYVDKEHRGQGLGSELARAVCGHLEALGVRRVMLATGDAHGVYEKAGFRSLETPERFMVRGQS